MTSYIEFKSCDMSIMGNEGMNAIEGADHRFLLSLGQPQQCSLRDTES